jgi:hypothetical protein
MKRKSLADVFLSSLVLLLVAGLTPCWGVELVHYPFEQVISDGAPTPVFTTPDSTGRNNTATLVGMTDVNLVPGRVGNALKFEGGTSAATRDRVEVLTPAPIPPETAPVLTDFNRTYTQFTFAALIKPIDIPETETDIAFIAGKLGNSPNRGWQIGWQGGATAAHPHELVVSIFDGPTNADHTDEIYSGPTTEIANDLWAHVAFTYSAPSESSQFFRMYINGVKVTEIDGTTTPAITTNLLNGINIRQFQVGNRGDSRADSWNGLIDEVHMYDTALTDAEILALVPPPLPPAEIGDFNQNGKVDGADYVVWRKNVGSASALPNDDGTVLPVGVDHYNLWRSKFGNGAGSGAGFESGGAVPEPASALIAVMASAFLLGGLGRGGRD